MADLAALMGFDFEDKTAAAEWEMTHFSSHEAIRDTAQRQGHGNLALWPLYPVNWDDWGTYALWHQSAHNEMLAALGLPGTDLTGVDWTDPQAREEWHQQHFNEHLAASTLLGI